MPELLMGKIELLPLFLEGAASVCLALVLCRAQPREHPLEILGLSLAFGALYALLPHGGLWLLVLAGLCAMPGVIVCFLGWIPVSYAAVCANLSLLLSGTLGLLRSSLKILGAPGWLPGLLAVLAAAVCWLCQAALLPEASGLLSSGGRWQTGGYSRSVLAMLAAMLLLDLWVWYQLLVLPRLPGAESAGLAFFAAAIVLGALAILRQTAFQAEAQAAAVIDRQYQAELLNFMQIIRSQRHDFNFHIQAISGMIRSGKYQECDEYVRDMVKMTAALNDVLPLREPAVSAMLNAFREMAVQKGIAFDVSISNDLSNTPCTVYETNTVIGNLIQNAIDEVEESGEHWISVLILKRGGNHIIKVTNPCRRDAGEFKKCFQPGYTTKQTHEGIGLVTVSRIVRKYNGSVFPEFDEGAVSFVIQLPGNFI